MPTPCTSSSRDASSAATGKTVPVAYGPRASHPAPPSRPVSTASPETVTASTPAGTGMKRYRSVKLDTDDLPADDYFNEEENAELDLPAESYEAEDASAAAEDEADEAGFDAESEAESGEELTEDAAEAADEE